MLEDFDCFCNFSWNGTLGEGDILEIRVMSPDEELVVQTVSDGDGCSVYTVEEWCEHIETGDEEPIMSSTEW